MVVNLLSAAFHTQLDYLSGQRWLYLHAGRFIVAMYIPVDRPLVFVTFHW